MDVFEAMGTRRSIRKYQDKPVSPEIVRDLLGAAMMAPSAGNAQAWQFIVVDDREKLANIRNLNPNAAMAGRAPMGILVCGDRNLEKYPGYWMQDCSAAMQNLLLAAHAKGLGAVWTGILPSEDSFDGFRRMFDLPEHVMPLGFAVIGWPAQKLGAEDRYDDSKVHHNTWGGK